MWSKLKKGLKKAWRVVKAVVRAVVRVAVIVLTAPFKIYDLFLGFLAWPPKRMTVHIVVLQDQNGPLIPPGELEKVLLPAIRLLETAYKDHCNVAVKPYMSGNAARAIDNWVQILPEPAPIEALESSTCSTWSQLNEQETGEAGDYFRKHVAGWVGGIPISIAFPITVFVIRSIGGYFGCTIPFAADYVLVTADGLRKEPATIAHEVGHRCNILREDYTDPTNLMFSGNRPNRPPYRLEGTQKNWVRSSRHVTYLF